MLAFQEIMARPLINDYVVSAHWLDLDLTFFTASFLPPSSSPYTD